jgi:hypothetical protein
MSMSKRQRETKWRMIFARGGGVIRLFSELLPHKKYIPCPAPDLGAVNILDLGSILYI